MEILTLLITNIIPLYILIALGYVVGRWMDVNLQSIATIAIYILAPFVNFGAMAKMNFTLEYIILPILFFSGSTLIGVLSYISANKFFKNNTANLIGMASVTGNTMYFGLPIILALLGPEWVGVYALLNLGAFFKRSWIRVLFWSAV